MVADRAVMKSPRSVDIEITGQCNLRCSYCSHFDSACDVDHDLPASEWLRFFEELKSLAVMDVSLSGGEPFLRPDFREIIDGIVRNRMRFTILTNGTLVTDELASFIASTRRCNLVQLSIDGSSPAVHDLCRGKGTFDKALNGLKCLIDHGVPVSVRVTIHKNNVKDLDNIARLLLDDLKLSGFSTNSVSPVGLCQVAPDLRLSIEDQVLAMSTLSRLNHRYNGRIQAASGPLAEARQWGLMVQAQRDGLERFTDGGRLTGCRCPGSKISVRADGAIVLCSYLGHIELGYINRDSLRDIWLHHPEICKLRERSEISLGEFEYCKNCVYRQYCTGGCPGIAKAMTGEVNRPSPDSCLRLFLQRGGKLPVSVSSKSSVQ